MSSPGNSEVVHCGILRNCPIVQHLYCHFTWSSIYWSKPCLFLAAMVGSKCTCLSSLCILALMWSKKSAVNSRDLLLLKKTQQQDVMVLLWIIHNVQNCCHMGHTDLIFQWSAALTRIHHLCTVSPRSSNSLDLSYFTVYKMWNVSHLYLNFFGKVKPTHWISL